MKIETDKYTIYQGDCFEVLKTMPAESVQMCVTSPPYYNLRDYQIDGQLGLEKTPEEYVQKMVNIFREVRRVLRNDGVLFLNLGDSYATGHTGRADTESRALIDGSLRVGAGNIIRRNKPPGYKSKDLIGIPWRVAFALQNDGWYLRLDIIWHKPNPMPESVTDRCTKSHEYIFLLSKSARYFYDAEAVKEDSVDEESYTGRRKRNPLQMMKYDAKHCPDKRDRTGSKYPKRNRRSVWTISTNPYKEAHFATFPINIPEICIKAGCPQKVCAKCGNPKVRNIEKGTSTGIEGKTDNSDKTLRNDALKHSGRIGERTTDTTGFSPTCDCNAGFIPGTVLDPFNGAGTSGVAALQLGRRYIGIELNPEYIELTKKRIIKTCPSEIFKQLPN